MASGSCISLRSCIDYDRELVGVVEISVAVVGKGMGFRVRFHQCIHVPAGRAKSCPALEEEVLNGSLRITVVLQAVPT